MEERDAVSKEPMLARDEISFAHLGSMLEDLADQLRSVADRAKSTDLQRRIASYESAGGGDEVIDAEIEREIGAIVVRTLSGMNRFRRNYDYYERAVAEWALQNPELSQRDVSRYLGVATSTVNRWAQNPLEAQVSRA